MTLPLLTILTAIPFVGGASILFIAPAYARRAWRVALATSVITLALSLVVLALFDPTLSGRVYQLNDVGPTIPLLGPRWHLGVDGFSVVMLPLASLLAVGMIAASPRRYLDQRTNAATLFMTGSAIGEIASLDLAFMTLFWLSGLLSVALLVLRRDGKPIDNTLWRNWTMLVIATVGPLIAAVAVIGALGARSHARTPFDLPLLIQHGIPAGWQMGLFVLIALAAGIRMSLFPFHGWLPLLLERAPLGVGVLLKGVHLGMALLVRVALPLLPQACDRGMSVLATCALFGSFYGSVLALAQQNLRRTLGFMLISQSGMMLTGVASMNVNSLNGAALQSLASAVSMSGIGLMLWAIEARTGTADLRKLGGLVTRCPRLAASFFMLAVASVGFPGSLNFVSEDLLLHGVLGAHPIVAILMLLCTVLNGITMLRAFHRTFLGPSPENLRGGAMEDLLPRERIAAVLLVFVVFGGGLMPGPMLRVRQHTMELLARVTDVSDSVTH